LTSSANFANGYIPCAPLEREYSTGVICQCIITKINSQILFSGVPLPSSYHIRPEGRRRREGGNEHVIPYHSSPNDNPILLFSPPASIDRTITKSRGLSQHASLGLPYCLTRFVQSVCSLNAKLHFSSLPAREIEFDDGVGYRNQLDVVVTLRCPRGLAYSAVSLCAKRNSAFLLLQVSVDGVCTLSSTRNA